MRADPRDDIPWWLWMILAGLIPVLVVLKLLSIVLREGRRLRYRRVELKRADEIVQIWRRKHLWLEFDPTRDRIIESTAIEDYTMASGWIGGDTLVIAEIQGSRVRFRIDDDGTLRWITSSRS